MTPVAVVAVAAAAAAGAVGLPGRARLAVPPAGSTWARPAFGAVLERPGACPGAALAVVLAVWPLVGIAPAAAAGIVVAAALPDVRDGLLDRRRHRVSAGWQAGLRSLAAALQAGAAPAVAFRRAAGSAEATGRVGAGIARAGGGATGVGGRGADLGVGVGVGDTLRAVAATVDLGGDAVSALAQRSRDGPGRRLAAALALAGELGAPPAVLALRLADSLAATDRAGRAATVALAGARTTTRLLAALPIAGLGLGEAFGASAPAYLLRTGGGHVCLLAGAALEAAGLAWTRRLLRSAAAP